MRIVLAMALMASGCAQAGDHNSSICSTLDVQDIGPATDRTGQILKANICVDNWSARLSRAHGSLSDIAEASVAACYDAILYIWRFPEREGVIEYTLEEKLIGYRRQALFRATQWQAGNCKLPDE